MSAGQGVQGWEEVEDEGWEKDEGWEMVSLTGDTCGKDRWERPTTGQDGTGRGGAGSVKGKVRHLPIPDLPRPPRSKPIAIPKKLTARRMGRSLSVTWDSQLEGEANILDPGTSGPRGFKEEPIFVFPSVDRKIRGGQWLWPEETRPRRTSHKHEDQDQSQTQTRIRPRISHRQDQWLRPEEIRHRPRTPPRKPYTAPFSDKGDRKELEGITGSGGLGDDFRSEGMEAPKFLHSFMPIPRIEIDYLPLEAPNFLNSFMPIPRLEMDDLPLDLSKMSL
jgi:hypothetical protein